MSGGTWEHRDSLVAFLAEDIREYPDTYFQDQGEPVPHDVPDARTAVADLLVVAAALVKELDYHFANDDHIDNEAEWLASAWERLAGLKGRFVGVVSPE